MGEATAIEWCDSTFNCWIGCTKVSPACDHCYAEALMDKRHGRVEWGGERSRTSASTWAAPRKWQRKAAEFFAEHGRRRRVFCASLADVFDNQVPVEWRADLWALIRDTPDLDWLLLTKRPQNIVKMVKAIGFMPSNIAFGTTIEDRKRTLTNLPHLMVAAGLRPRFLFASCEPLLEDLGDLSPWLRGDQFTQALADGERFEKGIKIGVDGWPKLPALGWVIVGGESGPGARPTHSDWIRSLRDQCEAASVPFLFKQWGEFVEVDGLHCRGNGHSRQHRDRTTFVLDRAGRCYAYPDPLAPSVYGPGSIMYRPGKKAAGRLLDGVTHDGFPQVVAR